MKRSLALLLLIGIICTVTFPAIADSALRPVGKATALGNLRSYSILIPKLACPPEKLHPSAVWSRRPSFIAVV